MRTPSDKTRAQPGKDYKWLYLQYLMMAIGLERL